MKRIVSAELDAELSARLERFAKAALTTKAAVIRMALDEFIAKALRENHGIRETYERLGNLGAQRGPLRVVK